MKNFKSLNFEIHSIKEIYKLDQKSEGKGMFIRKDVYNHVAYNSEKSHLLLHKMMKELLEKFVAATVGEEKEFPDLEKPYHFLAFGMPLKLMMEYLKS